MYIYAIQLTMKYTLSILSFLFVSVCTFSQEGNSSPFSIEADVYHGTILEHNPDIAHLITQHPKGVILSFNKKTYGLREAERRYGYPDWGFTFVYQDFQNPILGENYSLYGHFNWFFLNIKPESLTKALIWFKLPYHWAWTISSAYRFIALYQRETTELINAQLIRGVPLDGNVIEKIKSLGSLIIPLVYRTQILSQQFGEALFARSWIPAGKKSFLYPLAISRIDVRYLVMFIIFVIIEWPLCP